MSTAGRQQAQMADKRVFRTQMNGNMLGNSAEKSQSYFEIPMKIDKSRLLFLSGDLDDMEVDPGINSPSPGSRSPVKIEMKISETHSVRYKKNSVITLSEEVTPMQDMHSNYFDEETKTEVV